MSTDDVKVDGPSGKEQRFIALRDEFAALRAELDTGEATWLGFDLFAAKLLDHLKDDWYTEDKLRIAIRQMRAIVDRRNARIERLEKQVGILRSACADAAYTLRNSEHYALTCTNLQEAIADSDAVEGHNESEPTPQEST
jgi:hypothetical protein